MEVRLEVVSTEEGAYYRDAKKLEVHREEMKPEEFALKYATALRNDPSLDKDARGQFAGNSPVIAFILGRDPDRFKGRGLEMDRGIRYQPELLKMREVCGGKLVQITSGPNDADEHWFFRVFADGLKYLPYAEGCRVGTTEKGQCAVTSDFCVGQNSLAWPWIAFYPEKFARLIEFSKLLEPGDENPISGLVSERNSGLVRMAGHQIIGKVRRGIEQWTLDIVESL